MSEHTPAPWFLWTNDRGAFEITCDKAPDHRAVICGRNDWGHRAAESEANGRLIVAAPDMLAYLIHLLACTRSEIAATEAEGDSPTVLAALRRREASLEAIVAKAEGRS